MAGMTTAANHRPASLVAAAARLRRTGTRLDVSPAEWQNDAWLMYDLVGQARYVANTTANAVSRCPLYIADIDPDTGEIIGRADDPRLRPLAASPLGTGDRRRENVRLAALNLIVAGDVYLIGESKRDPSGRDMWYLASGFDFKRNNAGGGLACNRPQTSGGGTAVLDVGDGTDDRPGRDVIYRIWTPHPKLSDQADSPFRSAIPDLRILNTIRKRESAELDSRLAGAGILFLPDSFELPGDGKTQSLMDELAEIAGEVINDPSHPSALIPYILKVKGDDIDKVKLLNFWSDVSDMLGELTQRKVESLAQSFDAPVETTLGSGDTNHWNLWRIAQETILTHYEPLLSRIADGMTRVYLQPGAERLGINPDSVAYAFDTNVLQARGNQVDDALRLWDRRLISNDAMRSAAAFTDGDKPDKQELTARLAYELITARPELATGELASLAGLDPTAAPAVIVDADTTAPGRPAVDDDVTPERLDAPQQPSAPPAALTAAADGGILALANAAALRALELAGGRLVPQRPRSADRSTLHTTLTTTPTRHEAQQALRGAWDHIPAAAAALDGVDAAALTRALDAYTVELIRRRRSHDPAALAAVLALGGLT